jgi:hypothetical protein
MNLREILEQLEAADADPRPPLAYLAGHELAPGPEQLHGAFRRAELLLATGGDPRREIDLSDHAVSSVAEELEPLAAELVSRLAALADEADGLPRVSAALAELGEDPELALRVYAWALLAEHVADAD